VLGLPVWVVLLLGPAFVFVLLPLLHALNVWQMRRNNKALVGVLHCTVNKEGFELHGGNFEVKLNWDAIQRVVETRHFFLFYVATTMAHFLPKWWIESSEGLGETRAIIQDAVGEKAKLRSS